jgi:hypothetical protein
MFAHSAWAKMGARDSFFASIENRAIMELVVMNGSNKSQITRNLARDGFLRIYGRG